MNRVILAALVVSSAAFVPPAEAHTVLAGPFDSVFIFAPGGSRPIHVNTSGWDCGHSTWNAGTREYDVTCTSAEMSSFCGVVRVTAIGAPGTVIGTTYCEGGAVATAVSSGVAVAGGGVSPWHCIGVFILPGWVKCDLVSWG